MAIQQFPLPEAAGIPSGDTAGRPASPVIGDTYYNGTLGFLEMYTASGWVGASAGPAAPTIATPTDASATDTYTSTGGKLSVVFTEGSGGGIASQFNAFTTAGGFSASSSTSTVTITGLTPGTAYAVYGNTQNIFGTSVNTSNSNSVTPTTLPEVPTIGTATTSGVTTDVTVTWTLGSNGGKNLSAITITPFLNGTTPQTSTTAATTSSTSATIAGLTGNSSYTFKVKTTNANGSSADSAASNSVTLPNIFNVEYLVIAGGGGGGGGNNANEGASGGGAGGYLTGTLPIQTSTNYTATVGAGGAGSAADANATSGSNSVLSTQTATGGGFGTSNSQSTGGTGGSGGGAARGAPTTGASGTSGQGNKGGDSSGVANGGGGGGADAAGSNGTGTSGGNGGNGKASSITGTSVTRAGGGGGAGTTSQGTGGAGGGGAASRLTPVTTGNSGTVNTGGGGGANAAAASSMGNNTGGTGGSGVVIMKYPDDKTITIGAGLTGSTASPSGGFKVTTITAGSGNVSWA
jgi:hypothetical protein